MVDKKASARHKDFEVIDVVASEPANKAVNKVISRGCLAVIIYCILLGGCHSGPTDVHPSIEFGRVPLADEGGTHKLDTIEGRVVGARPGQRIVLFARSGAWYVQPFADQPFTEIRPDSSWRNSTHLGTDYAALLVEPEYHPPSATEILPNKGNGIVAVAIVPGEVRILVPAFWQSWWFRLSVGAAALLALLAFHRLRLHQLTRRLNLLFEERLAERMSIAQELHDTLLQGVLSASLQLHVAVESLPEDSPTKPHLNRVQQLMRQVIEEGHHTVRGLRSSISDHPDLEQAFARIPQELVLSEQIGFRVIVKGRPRVLHPILRDEVYRIGREALINAIRHSRVTSIEVELEYAAGHLRLLVRDDGHAIDPQSRQSGPAEDRDLSALRERAERIGSRFKVRSRAMMGTVVELIVPGQIAFPDRLPTHPLRWFSGWSPRRAIARLRKLRSRGDN